MPKLVYVILFGGDDLMHQTDDGLDFNQLFNINIEAEEVMPLNKILQNL
jgi:hypothetical protein